MTTQNSTAGKSTKQGDLEALARLPPATYGAKVVAEAEELGDVVDNTALEIGWTHLRGQVVRDGSVKCGRCKATAVYAGKCLYKGELVRYAELGGDTSHNTYVEDEQYFVCLSCGHVCHYPPEA
jgi:hypothetical protein